MNLILSVIVNIVLQLLATIGLVLISGKVIALCNACFYRNCRGSSRAVCYMTGIIGTPVHEISHAIFCLVFLHKIQEIKLFRISNDGVLGYVNHSYNPKNLYQRTGNFFIGIAPVIVGFCVLAGLFFLILPDAAASVKERIFSSHYIGISLDNIGNIFGAFVCLFSYASRWEFWLFVLIGSFIALHMTLSRADLDGAMSGIVFVILAFALSDIVLALVNASYMEILTECCITAGTFMLFFFVIFISISLILIAISFILKLFIRR